MKLRIMGLGFRIFSTCYLPFFILIFSFCHAQQYSASEEIRFVQYLIDNNQYHDAIYILKKQANQSLKISTSDSINYYIGWSYFNLKLLDSSFIYFNKVKGGTFYHQASFYSVFN